MESAGSSLAEGHISELDVLAPNKERKKNYSNPIIVVTRD